MKSFKLMAVVLVLAGNATFSRAQMVPAPGELAGAPRLALPSSSFSNGSSSAATPAQTNIADVQDRHDRKTKAIWLTSIFAMGAATGADAISSWHKQESNGLLASSNGSFGAKGIGVKMAVASAVVVPQILFRKHKELRTAFIAGNFAEAGIFTGAVIHNVNLPSSKP